MLGGEEEGGVGLGGNPGGGGRELFVVREGGLGVVVVMRVVWG
jgi:hypothetical protein